MNRFDDSAFADVLKSVVTETGLVRYARLKSDPTRLDAFLGGLARIDSEKMTKWPEADRIAFWLNAYNAVVLRFVCERYPLRERRDRQYPANSIHQIEGVWDKLGIEIAGQKRTLNEIEHEILRKEFDEPRIHMALVCAANGCPPLRAEPYKGTTLDRQLDDQVRRFLRDSNKFRIDRNAGEIRLSSIFQWFGKDFARFADKPRRNPYREPDKGVLGFISHYLTDSAIDYAFDRRRSIKYIDYDWTLNDAAEE